MGGWVNEGGRTYLEVHDAAQLVAGQGAEDDDVVEPVFWGAGGVHQ